MTALVNWHGLQAAPDNLPLPRPGVYRIEDSERAVLRRGEPERRGTGQEPCRRLLRLLWRTVLRGGSAKAVQNQDCCDVAAPLGVGRVGQSSRALQPRSGTPTVIELPAEGLSRPGPGGDAGRTPRSRTSSKASISRRTGA